MLVDLGVAFDFTAWLRWPEAEHTHCCRQRHNGRDTGAWNMDVYKGRISGMTRDGAAGQLHHDHAGHTRWAGVLPGCWWCAAGAAGHSSSVQGATLAHASWWLRPAAVSKHDPSRQPCSSDTTLNP